MNIRLENAGHKYNRNWIFRNLNVNLKSPGSLAVLGPNGSGKSTLLQVFAGWISLSEGEAIFSNHELDLPESRLSTEQLYFHISMSAPYLDLPEELTMREVMSLQASLKGTMNGLSEVEIIKLSGLSLVADRQIKYFSSGMKQRLKLILAFVAPSQLLLLDEPLSNLDQEGRSWYADMIKTFSENRMVVIASNDSDEYAFCNDQIQIDRYK